MLKWGEPWRTFLSPDDMASLLARHGFAVAEQVGQREAIAPALWQRRDPLRPVRLSMLARAVVTGQTRAGTPPGSQPRSGPSTPGGSSAA